MSINRKKILSKIILLMSLIGIALVAYPFIVSLSISEKSLNNSIVSCSVLEMKPGQIIRCNSAFIYKRTENDKKNISIFTYLLADPQSIYSKQPDNTKNKWRSKNSDYFIYYQSAPGRRCPVSLQTPLADNKSWYVPPEKVALEILPYFTEQCEGRAWDTSGRLYRREGYPEEFNLTVPITKWVSKHSVYIYGGQE